MPPPCRNAVQDACCRATERIGHVYSYMSAILDYDRERILRIMTSLRHLNPENTDFLLDSASRGGVTIYSIRNIGERYCFTGSFNNPAQ